MQAEEFSILHNQQYKFYCEIVILPDGDVQYAIPSHQYKLCTLYGIDYENDILEHSDKYEELLNKIPMTASPTHWMIEDLNVISCWYDACISPITYTEDQIKALQTLKKHHCIADVFNVDISTEKTLMSVRDSITDESYYEDLFNKREEAKLRLEELINGRV